MAGKQAFELSIDLFSGWNFFDPKQTIHRGFGRLCSVLRRVARQGCQASQTAKTLIELSYAAIPSRGRNIWEEFDRVVTNGRRSRSTNRGWLSAQDADDPSLGSCSRCSISRSSFAQNRWSAARSCEPGKSSCEPAVTSRLELPTTRGSRFASAIQADLLMPSS